MKDLPALGIAPKTGTERFQLNGHPLPENLLDFWKWSSSNIVGNALRGILAQYIVAMAVQGDEGTRTEWDAYDVLSPEGIKIEIQRRGFNLSNLAKNC